MKNPTRVKDPTRDATRIEWQPTLDRALELAAERDRLVYVDFFNPT